ncbi:MAG: endonuclease III [Archangium sp.]|nr:endonuclease III [Archangium sp.]MDP3151258.1 endonuclease III [Archangium sp.]MDP3570101.1 endonuclease III [Archangium sp.]
MPALGIIKGKEPAPQKRARAVEIIERLDHAMPEAKIELDYRSPLELVVAVALSAQTTDKRVNLVTPALFQRFPTAADYAKAAPAEVEGFLKTVGLFRNKTKNLIKLGQVLVEKHGGEVPTSRAALAELPGVGNKTAGVVTIHLGAETAFPVDTHILRLSRRLGLTSKTDPDDVEADLRKVLPEPLWFKAHQLIIWHGRRCCDALRPECHRCVVADLCPKKGVKLKKK